MANFPYLGVLVLLPIGAALVLAVLPVRWAVLRILALAAGAIELMVSLAVMGQFRVGDPGYQLVSRHPFVADFGMAWNLGVDGISLFLTILTAVLTLIALAGSREDIGMGGGGRGYLAWMVLLEGACAGSFLSLDLFMFFLFFELTLIPTYFLIGAYGSDRRAFAAMKFFLYTLLGSAFLFVAMLAAVYANYERTGHLTFNLVTLARDPMTGVAATLAFLGFTIAFAVKAPVFPFHTWSPDAYREAPTGAVIMLAGVMAKLGTYGMLRFDLALFPRPVEQLAPLMMTLAVIGILYGAIAAAAQSDLKRLIAYSSLSHMGFIVLGIFSLSPQAVTGAVIEMANHGIYTAGLFAVVAMTYHRYRTFDADLLGGAQADVPVLAGFFVVIVMAAIGLPGLNGFVGEFLILLGTFQVHRWWAAVATAGVILSAVYLLWAYQRVFHGPKRSLGAQPALVSVGPGAQAAGVRGSSVKDLSLPERLVAGVIVVIVVGLGVYPKPLLDRITPSTTAVVAHVDAVAGSNYGVPGYGSGARNQTEKGQP